MKANILGLTSAQPRPNLVKVGLAILLALYLYSLYWALKGGIQPQHMARVLPGLIATPLVLIGAWVGIGAMRWVLALLLVTDVIIRISMSMQYRHPISIPEGIYQFLSMVGIVVLFLGSSNAWFRARREARRHSRWYLAWVIAGFVLLVPATLTLLAVRPGLNLVGSGNLVFMGLIYVMLVPAMIFGRPHFMFGIGAGPATPVGVFLFYAFWFVVLFALALLWWRFTRPRR